MKSILLSAVAILGLSVAVGCTTTTSDGSGGGGEGGDGSGGGSTTNVTTGTTTNSSTSTGGLECDSGTAGDINSTECDACLDCAIDPAGPCAQPLSVCQASASCQGYVACLQACPSDDTATPEDEFILCLYGTEDETAEPTADSCVGQNPTGADEYIDILSCGICQECPVNCDAASVCTSG
jgi:hypothetical protein